MVHAIGHGSDDEEQIGGSPGGPMQALLNKPRLSLRAFTNKTGETRTEIERRGSAMVQAVKRNPVVACIRGNLLTLCTLLGVILGIVVGFVLRASQETKWTPRNIMYIKFVGELFLRMLKMLIVPLIASSLISAVGGLDLSLSKKIGIRAVGYYMITTILAVILGLVLVVVIHPGHGDLDAIQRTGAARNITTVDTLMDLIRNLFPPNLVQATIESYRTVLVPPKKEEEEEAPSRLDDLNIYEESTTTPAPSPKSLLLTWEIESEFFSSTNILGLVMFSFVFGVAICRMEEKGKILQDFFASLADAMMTITSWVIYISPIGVASLCAGQVLEMDDLSVIVGQLGMYFLTVLTGILIHGLITLPALYVIVTREMPFTFMLNMMEAIMTAFGTSSSSATLPVTFRCLENKNGIDQRVSRFVLPIGATINMDGTALYEAVAAIFISQMRGMTLGIGSIIAISITSTAASIGAAGIPSAGLVTLVMVLDTVGLPAEDVTLIIAVDWLLDRFRTACNVWGDSIGAAMVAHLSSKEVLDMDHEKMDRVSRPSVAPGMASAPAGIEMTSSDWDKANGGRSNEFPVESTNM